MLHDFTTQPYDILIQAGQSNSEGCGLGAVTHSFYQDGNIHYLTPDFIIALPPRRYGATK